MTPVEFKYSQLTVRNCNNYIIKYTPDESGLFNIATDGMKYKVLSDTYQEVKNVGNDTFFLQKGQFRSYYYVVLENESLIKDTIIDFSVNKTELETITVKKQYQAENKSVCGREGEVKFYLIDITEKADYELFFYGAHGNKQVRSEIYENISFGFVGCQGFAVGNNDCFYVYSNFEVGQYYLRLEFSEDFSFELSFI